LRAVTDPVSHARGQQPEDYDWVVGQFEYPQSRFSIPPKYIHPTNESMKRAVARKKAYADQQMQRATKKKPVPGVFPRVADDGFQERGEVAGSKGDKS